MQNAIASVFGAKKEPSFLPDAKEPALTQRVVSVDVYRGFVMLLMMAEILSFETVSKALPGSLFWQIVAFNQSHVPWNWLSLHDTIQPSFSFLVGVALPYSIASRKRKGATFGALMRHTIVRSIILICLGIFLRSMHFRQTYFTFEDTLTQIGLGYTFLVLLSFCSRRVQITALVIILVGYWLAFVLYPLPGPGFDYALTGVPQDWPYNVQGFAAHWNKNTNLAWAFDRWFLNLFPRESPFVYHGGGYATLSFIPTLGTMMLGLLAGQMLRSGIAGKEKLKFFISTGLGLVVLGIVLQITGINPIVKRIWTPAWTIFSGGISFLFLAFFYGTIDLTNRKKWSFLFMVIGMNSIVAYVLADGFSPFIVNSLYIHLGAHYDQLFGTTYATLVKGGIVLLIEWLILYWMYRKKIFVKI
jgi:predicted acyltransferase